MEDGIQLCRLESGSQLGIDGAEETYSGQTWPVASGKSVKTGNLVTRTSILRSDGVEGSEKCNILTRRTRVFAAHRDQWSGERRTRMMNEMR